MKRRLFRSSAVALAIAFASPLTAAQTPTLIKDINTTRPVRHSYPSPARANVGGTARDYLKVGTRWYFAADSGQGMELHVTDGTPAGTRQVADINAGTASSFPSDLVASNGTVYFQALAPATGRELYKTDGSAAGTVLVRDIQPGRGSSSPEHLCPLPGARVVFSATTGASGTELWISNGTASGTKLIKDIEAGIGSSSPQGCFPMSPVHVLFTAKTAAAGPEVWISDGTAAGTRLVKDIRPGSVGSQAADFRRVGRTVLFRADDGRSGSEIWRTDGTTAGTALVKDIRPGSSGSAPRLTYARVLGTSLYFAADDGSSGHELWKSDGTRAGTVLVRDIRSGTTGSSPSWFTPVGALLYFTATDNASGNELWATDGTSAGTARAADVFPGPRGSYPIFLQGLGKRLVFAALGAGLGNELYITDTNAGAKPLKDIRAGSASSQPRYLTAIGGGRLLFSATDGLVGTEVFETDGTRAGTKLLVDLHKSDTAPTNSSSPSAFAEMDGELYFAADDAVHGKELWKSDGSARGTKLVRDLWPGARSSSPRYLTFFRNEIYFQANSNDRGAELWKTDGTAAGTTMVTDIDGGPGSSMPSNFCVYKGKLYFAATRRGSSPVGTELFVTDGTPLGTQIVRDIAPGSASSTPAFLTVYRDRLFFAARRSSNNGGAGRELWVSDGTAAGTKRAVDIWTGPSSGNPSYIAVFKDKLVFAADSGNGSGSELYESDGTASGTRMIRDIYPGSASSFSQSMVDADGTLFFAARDMRLGMELHKSDGTRAGTVLVADIHAGSADSSPTAATTDMRFRTLGSRVFFNAFDGSSAMSSGREAYVSDGSAASTTRIADLWPGTASSSPRDPTYARGVLYFSAHRQAEGRELFAWRTSRASAVAFGDSCGPNYPTLRSTAPVLGSRAILSGKANKANGVGLLYLGVPGKAATILGCSDYVGVLSAFNIAGLTANAAREYSHPFVVPNTPALSGIRVKLQAWWLTPPTILPIETTNAVQFTIGN